MNTYELSTKHGKITGIKRNNSLAFLGIPYAHANRFEYAEKVEGWDWLDATKNGDVCEQTRAYFPRLDNPARLFYHREFRDGLVFSYSENCLNLNIFTPQDISSETKYPVILYFHGGSFNSGANCDGAFDGEKFAEKDVITVFANYRVGIFGYITHEEIFNKNQRDGNFGLDDQQKALEWVYEHIEDFGGTPENITLMGQSAGAISTQYLCLNEDNKKYIKRAIMLSGGGKFPDFALPKQIEQTRIYWQDFLSFAKIPDFEELKTMEASILIAKLEDFKATRKDNMYNTMPVIDGILLKKSVQKMIKSPLKIDYLLGYTNSDMYAPLMAYIEHKYAKQNHAYIYFFDINPKGDKTKAFHSSDLRYAFNTLEKSWRPFEKEDYEAAELLQNYLVNFAYSGNPNINPSKKANISLPEWHPAGKLYKNRAMHIRAGKKCKMTGKHYLRLLINMLTELKLV